jgi:mRNA interferase RelE/StbE
MYHVFLGQTAKERFEESEKSLQAKLDRCFECLAENPRRHNNIKPLKGSFAGYLRFRVGDYRVVYRVEEPKRRVVVVDIAHRKDVYE